MFDSSNESSWKDKQLLLQGIVCETNIYPPNGVKTYPKGVKNSLDDQNLLKEVQKGSNDT